MGISMSVSPLSDAEILALAQDTARWDKLDRGSSPDACYLADFWDGLHFLLTDGTETQTLPLAALKIGDITYRSGLEAAHAILSNTAQSFAVEIQRLSEPTLRKRCDFEAMLKARVYPVRTWAFPEHAERTYRELIFYFERLKAVTVRATESGAGLLFYRYEDL